jgi:O-antigen biosynthesis protein WbqP
MVNRILALILLLFISPLFFLISIIIFFEDGLPFFFVQKRIGFNSKLFLIYKFRSMKKDTPNVATHLLDNPNKYLLKAGKILRKLSLDELPNLINIIRGEMVFVGPRPALFNQYDLIELRKKFGVDQIKPGITGWAQVNGRDEISLEQKVTLEKEYKTRKSIFFDLFILYRTLILVFKSKNISH